MSKRESHNSKVRDLFNVKSNLMIAEKERERKYAIGPNEETKTRIEIHNTIKKLLREGKNKLEILTELNNKFPNSKLSKYFSNYIEHHMNKIKDNTKDMDR